MSETLALRLYGKNDIRLEKFALPAIGEDEILADVVSNSICMSDHKAASQGSDHKRVPKDIQNNPIMLGHEFCGRLLKVGPKLKDRFVEGAKYSIQPALNIPGRHLDAPGYSFRQIGGYATRIVIPQEVMGAGCLLPYEGRSYFKASLSEPVSCIIGAFRAQYHFKNGEYTHEMGIVEGGNVALLAAAGPMGLCSIDYALHGPRRPRILVVTDIDQARLDRAKSLYTPEHARTLGIELHYVLATGANPVQDLLDITGGKGYDDVFVFAPVGPVVEQGDQILGNNGCLNFFAGPSRPDFKASINFYDVHYSGHHLVGTSGGNTEDMQQGLELMSKGQINPAVMVTHIGGIDAATEAIKNLPSIPGGKKLIYTNISLPLTALDDLDAKGKTDPMLRDLGKLVSENSGLWSDAAEEYLLAHAKPITDALKVTLS